MTTARLTQIVAIPAFGGGTTALEVGDELWIGSYRGDRIAVVPR